ncbi:SAM hydrolase/SAM-dependent halogenase family protein, partial [Kaarinaea lacus]
MRAVLVREAPSVPVIELFNDAPSFNPVASSYLLAAYIDEFPAGTVFLGVVDPGVGSKQRKPMIYRADDRWFVGPGNGLFDVILARSKKIESWEITWRPDKLSNTFHGRDLFAPVAACLARGESPPGKGVDNPDIVIGPGDWPCVIYIDHFGNAMTGLRARNLNPAHRLIVGAYSLERADTFADVPIGQPFWYENANGLVEFSINQGRAVDMLGISLGDRVTVVQE